MSNLPKYNDRKGQGWYLRDNKWFLTFGATLREFNISKEDLTQLLRTNKVEMRTLINSHNGKAFTVYSLEELKKLIQTEPVKPLVDFYEKKARQLVNEILEREKK